MNAENKRIVSLDFLRGLTIAAMILVNNPGNYKEEYQQFGHAQWNGLTFTDFIFPCFIYIAGVSITLSLSSRKKQGCVRPPFRKIIKRTVLLILCGLFVNLLIYPSVGGFRIAGVLQRIAIVYFVCSVLFSITNWKTQTIVGGLILIIYWMALAFIPVPGLGHPSLEPVNNLVSWTDRKFLPGMLYAGNHDPEGILSTFPAIVSGITGMLSGILLINTRDRALFVKRLILLGTGSLIIGILWSLVFPINKNLWTSSYVLVTSGAAAIFLAICIWLLDIKSWKTGILPFKVLGSNAIAAYLLSFIFLYLVWPPFFHGKAIIQICWAFFVSLGCSPKFSSLIWAVLYTTLCFIPAYILYRKHIFLKL